MFALLIQLCEYAPCSDSSSKINWICDPFSTNLKAFYVHCDIKKKNKGKHHNRREATAKLDRLIDRHRQTETKREKERERTEKNVGYYQYNSETMRRRSKCIKSTHD